MFCTHFADSLPLVHTFFQVDSLCVQREKGQGLNVPTHFNPLIEASTATSSSLTDEKEEMDREANGAYARMIFSLAKENLTDLYRF